MAAWPYSTTAWKRLRLQKLRADPLCEYCPPNRVTAATVVDHRKPISAGGEPFDFANLASSCQSCHSQKTARGEEAGSSKTDRPMHDRPRKGCNPDGWPIDPNHPWAT